MRSFFLICSNRSAVFPESAAADLIFFLNPQLATRSFFKKLSPGPEDFLKNSATASNFFRNSQQRTRVFFYSQQRGRTFFSSAQGFAKPPTENVMINGGLGHWEGGGSAAVFPETSATGLRFFCNCQLPPRAFF